MKEADRIVRSLSLAELISRRPPCFPILSNERSFTCNSDNRPFQVHSFVGDGSSSNPLMRAWTLPRPVSIVLLFAVTDRLLTTSENSSALTCSGSLLNLNPASSILLLPWSLPCHST